MFTNLINLVISLALAAMVVVAVGGLTKKSFLDREMMSPFECGFDSTDRGLLPFSLRFYLLANIFLIFDVELILLFPFMVKLIWVSIWASIMMFGTLLLMLSLGLFYEWNQKMLEWVT